MTVIMPRRKKSRSTLYKKKVPPFNKSKSAWGVSSSVLRITKRAGNYPPSDTLSLPDRQSVRKRTEVANVLKKQKTYRTQNVTPYTTDKHLSLFRQRDRIHPATESS